MPTNPKQFWVAFATLIFVLLLQTASAVWWAGSITAAVKENTKFRCENQPAMATVRQNSDWIKENKTIPITVAVQEQQVRTLNDSICNLVSALKETNDELKGIRSDMPRQGT